jgi:hypothetical protein
MKNPEVYRGSKEIDIAIIWPNCFYMAIFEREKISTTQLIEKTKIMYIILGWLLLYLFCPSIVTNAAIVTPEHFNRNESGSFGTVKSDSTHHFFGNACTKSGL